uniref:Stringent starvation protein B n=1 Tax=Candidatus Kentrum sp. TUN TaxID=2126343 RepID=A0A450ZUV4_9GAMM|nr:MAG: stringent starvation protein B [Candidatus Kentron sp. TUN]
MQNSSDVPMTSTRPYLIRAIHEWIVDNALTPYILINAQADGASVPGGYTKDGKIVFNISSNATKNLYLGNEEVTFTGRFNGMSIPVSIPTDAVLAVYAKETGAGMAFQDESREEEQTELPKEAQGLEEEGSTKEKSDKEEPEEGNKAFSQKPPTSDKPSRPTLRIVK